MAAQPIPDDFDSLIRLLEGKAQPRPAIFAPSDIRFETVRVLMRDKIGLATDLYLPPLARAPAIALRTPYDRARDSLAGLFLMFARRGYAVVAQDCRGTGASEPEQWDYLVYEADDSMDLVDWIGAQSWFDGFLGACGSSYEAQVQWGMAMHPQMSAIVPEVSGLGIAHNSARLHMFLNAYKRTVGKGEDKVQGSYVDLERSMLEETLTSGCFDDAIDLSLPASILARYPELASKTPRDARQHLWDHYCGLDGRARADFVAQALGSRQVTIAEVEALPSLFGQAVAHDAHSVPRVDSVSLCRDVQAPALMVTGWYDWGLNDALATWEKLDRDGTPGVIGRNRLIVTPGAHNTPGYREGAVDHPELRSNYRMNPELLLAWYDAVRTGEARWPRVTYYLMGANEWRSANEWPPADAQPLALFLAPDGALTRSPPSGPAPADSYWYDPADPTPTLGGSIVSSVYLPGSVDVSAAQTRSDVLTYTTEPLSEDLDVVGPIRLILHIASSAPDTDFVGRLSDVFPDGRAIQLQNGLLRTRYRDSASAPKAMDPGAIYKLDIDMWATANRFKAGHRLRLDISSADFPRFERNLNRVGNASLPTRALQTVFRDFEHPSHLLMSVLGHGGEAAR